MASRSSTPSRNRDASPNESGDGSGSAPRGGHEAGGRRVPGALRERREHLGRDVGRDRRGGRRERGRSGSRRSVSSMTSSGSAGPVALRPGGRRGPRATGGATGARHGERAGGARARAGRRPS